MRMLLCVVIAAGCGSSAYLTTCGSEWLTFYDAKDISAGCDSKCTNPPAGYGSAGSNDPTCTVIDPSIDEGHGGPTGCQYTTFSDGTKGCCLFHSPSIAFAECEGQ